MSLLYVEEHLKCKHYRKDNVLVEILSFPKDEIIETPSSDFSRIYFLLGGALTFSSEEVYQKEIRKDEFFLVSPNCNFSFKVVESVYCIVVRFETQFNLCENFSMTQLYDYCDKDVKPLFTVLSFKERLSSYLKLLEQYLLDGVNCVHLQELKIQELFFVLRAYYPKEDLAAFFYVLLNKEDLHFKAFVMEKCLCAKNIQELSRMANYSTSGFIKKFTRNFHDSPYRWIMQYKANRILQDINQGEKSLRDICSEYNFSSMSHFISFCKKRYGDTPGRLRKKE